MAERVFNFSAGPAVLPVAVLEQAAQAVLEMPGQGISVLELSHRSKPIDAVLAEAKQLLTELLGIPAGYSIVFLQGGSSLQFSMVPMNLLRGAGAPADYIMTGSWASKARDSAKLEGETHVAWDGKSTKYSCMPSTAELQLTPGAAYVHMTANETIQGIEFTGQPEVGDAPLVNDVSSNFLSRPIDVAKYGLIYACAQKNAGIAGITAVILRDDLLERVPKDLPPMLDFKLQIENDSRYNTPPVFALYVLLLVLRWLKNDIGGLAKMAELNRAKAKLLYDVLDAQPEFYRGHARLDSRSQMNVTWRLPSEELEATFLKQSKERGLVELKGHRSVGGIRASIYNAMPAAGVEALRDFMLDFHKQHSS
ncbi:MAG: 3-phosphoserine/phosphohydroxythreonine transaminase [Pirellulales bacterium]